MGPCRTQQPQVVATRAAVSWVTHGFEEMDGSAVSKAVRVKRFDGQTGTGGPGAALVFCQQVPHAESSQRRPAVIDEERVASPEQSRRPDRRG